MKKKKLYDISHLSPVAKFTKNNFNNEEKPTLKKQKKVKTILKTPNQNYKSLEQRILAIHRERLKQKRNTNKIVANKYELPKGWSGSTSKIKKPQAWTPQNYNFTVNNKKIKKTYLTKKRLINKGQSDLKTLNKLQQKMKQENWDVIKGLNLSLEQYMYEWDEIYSLFSSFTKDYDRKEIIQKNKEVEEKIKLLSTKKGRSDESLASVLEALFDSIRNRGFYYNQAGKDKKIEDGMVIINNANITNKEKEKWKNYLLQLADSWPIMKEKGNTLR